MMVSSEIKGSFQVRCVLRAPSTQPQSLASHPVTRVGPTSACAPSGEPRRLHWSAMIQCRRTATPPGRCPPRVRASGRGRSQKSRISLFPHSLMVKPRTSCAGRWARAAARIAAFSALHYALFAVCVLLALSDGLWSSGPPSAASRMGDALCDVLTLPFKLLEAVAGGAPAIREYRDIAFAGNCLCYGALLELIWRRWRAIRRKRAVAVFPSCGVCGYNLTANVSGTCPECGTAIPCKEGDCG
jgi:hypothetical protein